ncbi:LysR substrate-binding domain-containing protein [Zoogloea sp.]|uniref:LysR substrate-binding domain-containing protein n=1 Tax=Zoogloea sp. TaxID=49181 RepID=UPI0026247B45|nr:LysR substrate-binding domain-containing protein [Zoogloea sp.]MDD3355249.1 LysR substrate-binding domain-containing protein [Zoogloea sp.]
MDLRALRYFIETVRQNSFTLAAERLHVTQSTVSKMIRQLESEVGQPLLLREGRQLRLTDAGQVVFEKGQQAVAMVREISLALDDLSSLQRGTLTVGLPPMLNLLFTPAVATFRERYPGVVLRLQESGGQVIERQVADGELEVGVTLLPAAPALGLACRSLGAHPIDVIGSREASWAGKASVQLTDLRDEPLVLPSDDFSLTRQIRDAFREEDGQLRIAAQSSQWDFLVAMTAAGLGTTLLPRPLLARLHLDDRLISRPLVHPTINWHPALIRHPERYLSRAAQAWLDLCQEVLQPPRIR